MGDYGTHPTRYGRLSNDDLYAMYRSSVYSRLDESKKLDLLQETVNRDALERGESGTPRVTFASLESNVSGEAANGVIRINYDMAVKGRQTFEYQGQTMVHEIDDYNIQALNTALHENAHCFQEQVADGTITIPDNALTEEYQANSFAVSMVEEDGSYKPGSQYLRGETPAGYSLYYFQATERDAYREAEQKTNNIIRGLTEKFGSEPSFDAYAKSLEVNGYHAMEEMAAEIYNNPNFEYNVNRVLQNQYFGTNVSVNPGIEKAVKSEMTASYMAMQNQLDSKPVSLEEYNQTLRDSVNAYYTHAINDPSMSREDAIRSTGEMAERYLESVEEFQEAQPGMTEGAAITGVAATAEGPVIAGSSINSGDGIHSDGIHEGGTVEDGIGEDEIGEGGAVEDGIDEGGIDDDGIDGEGCDDGMDP